MLAKSADLKNYDYGVTIPFCLQPLCFSVWAIFYYSLPYSHYVSVALLNLPIFILPFRAFSKFVYENLGWFHCVALFELI